MSSGHKEDADRDEEVEGAGEPFDALTGIEHGAEPMDDVRRIPERDERIVRRDAPGQHHHQRERAPEKESTKVRARYAAGLRLLAMALLQVDGEGVAPHGRPRGLYEADADRTTRERRAGPTAPAGSIYRDGYE